MTSESVKVVFLLRVLVPGGAAKVCFLNSFSNSLQKSSTFTKISATLSEKSGVSLIDLFN